MGYTDSSFQSDCDDSRSMSSYVFTLNGGAVCWKSFKQYTVIDSVCEVEYNAASDATTYSASLSTSMRDHEPRWRRALEDRQKRESSWSLH